MAANPSKTSILLNLDRSVAERITEYAKLDGRTRIDLIREALDDYLTVRLNCSIAEQYRAAYADDPDVEDDRLIESTKRMILEEPW